jgi:hypothetical protein
MLYNFLYSVIAFSLAMNALMAGVTLCALITLNTERRRAYSDKLDAMPAWARKLVNVKR